MKRQIGQPTPSSNILSSFIKKFLGASSEADTDGLKKENEDLKEKLADSERKLKALEEELEKARANK